MSSSAFALFIAIAAGGAIAQSTTSYLGQFPDCAQQPLVQGIANSGCVVTDLDCICDNQSLISNLATAIAADCNKADQSTSLDAALKLCPDAFAADPSSQSSSDINTSMTTAVVSVPGLTTTFMMSMQPTSVPVTISVPISTIVTVKINVPNLNITASSSSANTTSSTDILTDTSAYILTDTSAYITGTATSAKRTSTMTRSATSASSTGGASSSELGRFGWMALGMGAMGVVFAEF